MKLFWVSTAENENRASIVAIDESVARERVLAHAESGSIKRLRVGAEAAEANLRDLLSAVYEQAGVTSVTAACCGVASCSLPEPLNGSPRCFRSLVRSAAKWWAMK